MVEGTSSGQVTFSVNCNIASSCGGSGTFGFWGWCEFGGTDPTAMTGNSEDCQITDYGRAGPGMPQNPAHNSIDASSWHIAAAPNNAPSARSIVDSATATRTGPSANTQYSPALPQIPLFTAIYSHLSG